MMRARVFSFIYSIPLVPLLVIETIVHGARVQELATSRDLIR